MYKEIERLLNKANGALDTETPETGHRERFLRRLETVGEATPIRRTKKWYKPLSIAASFAVLIAIGIGIFNRTPPTLEEQVANISPEVANTEYYFASLIEERITSLQSQSTPETEQLIDDTMKQLQKLKVDYKKLEKDLLDGGNSKLILSAMITNFQTRIDLLQDVLNKTETIKNLKKQNDTNFTI
ncbi:hypothetical protein FGM00_04340 [Aggregatimonas sangjinii]|uniref:DUF4179 domain-containing protein n=1 Tax=Aggregatimonas sangjinii TaxID=2583587 RepID=A0A5B7SLQ9_9FLAO|nr:hypothetical protein [Aggregatimonas sangjinii]QCW99376.1 hypothetical protein FGM00_04340 [Aggregatimonas sangjinii]